MNLYKFKCDSCVVGWIGSKDCNICPKCKNTRDNGILFDTKERDLLEMIEKKEKEKEKEKEVQTPDELLKMYEREEKETNKQENISKVYSERTILRYFRFCNLAGNYKIVPGLFNRKLLCGFTVYGRMSIIDDEKRSISFSISFQSPKDQFSRKKGRKIANSRYINESNIIAVSSCKNVSECIISSVFSYSGVIVPSWFRNISNGMIRSPGSYQSMKCGNNIYRVSFCKEKNEFDVDCYYRGNKLC